MKNKDTDNAEELLINSAGFLIKHNNRIESFAIAL